MNERLVSERFPYIPIVVRFPSVPDAVLEIQALVDTGFDGSVTLPPELLPDEVNDPRRTRHFRLADGSEVTADTIVRTLRVPGGVEMNAIIVLMGDEVLVGRAFTDRFSVLFDHGRRVVVEP